MDKDPKLSVYVSSFGNELTEMIGEQNVLMH